MTLKAALLSALLAATCPSFAMAGPVADAAARAERLQSEGKTAEALEALGQAVDAVWTAAPLGFRTVALVESAGPMGTFQERAAGPFRPDDKLRVYVEPVGYAYGGAGGSARIGFTTDLAIENGTGQILSEEAGLFSIVADSAQGRREFGMTLAFGVPYLRPGDYVARFTVHDQNSPKTGTFELPFTVAAPAAAGAEAAPAGDTAAAPDATTAPDPAAPAQEGATPAQ